MIRYRVKIKVGYNEAFFDFTDSTRATNFANSALLHSVKSEDTENQTKIIMSLEEVEPEEEEEDNE